jgi:hypothetical protein
VRCNNINVTYGYAKKGFEIEANEDGLHSPSILKEYQKQGTEWEAVLGIVKFCC